MALLELHSLQAGYGAAPVLHDLSLHVDSGEMVGIVGANGAGKTSVVRAVAGLLAPQRGSIRLAGREVTCGRKPESCPSTKLVPATSCSAVGTSTSTASRWPIRIFCTLR